MPTASRSPGCIAPSRRPSARSSRPTPKHELPFELGMGAVDMPFAIPNLRVENPEAAAHTRIGWFRSVSNIPHAFAIQSFVAELAAALGTRPQGLSARADRPAAADRCRRRCRTPGSTARTRSSIRSTPGGCVAVVENVGERGGLGTQAAAGPRPRHRRAPQLRELRRGAWSRRRSDPRASSRSRASTSPSTAAPWSIPTACARSSRAPWCRASASRPWARSASRTAASSRPTSTATS